MRLRIGFLGLGTMGEPIANNLRKAGHDLTVWNRTASKADHIVKKGGSLAQTPRACAEGRDLVFTCLSDEKAIEAVLEGDHGILAALKPGDVLVDLSTAGTRAARSVAERVRRAGASFVAAPVLGSRHAAEQAQLVVVAGGPAAGRDRARAPLHAISARLFELESPEQAALMKLCVNAIGAAMMAGFAEALALGRSGGIEVANLVEVLQASSFHSPLFLMKGELVQNGDYAPRFALRLAEKDQRLAEEAAAEQGAKMPINEAVRKVLLTAIDGGRGELDYAAVTELFFDWVKR
ncbi:MAG TPA: NAD(P)-dependent oxidoreductase [Anaeromyxobacteraceae bacterium]|nr:NAD(P)-dependent oxidoreductase [Anaeromyxobacteraceae bacterium]